MHKASLMFPVLFALAVAEDSSQVSIAVLDFEAKGVGESEASILSDKFREQLMATGKFSVLERSAMDAILTEQGFQQTGCVSTECAVELGQLVGVGMIVAGSIGKLEELYLVSARLIDVRTGVIQNTVSEETRESLTAVLRSSLPRLARRLAGLQVEERPSKDKSKAPPSKGRPTERRIRPYLSLGFTYSPGSGIVTLDSVGGAPLNDIEDVGLSSTGATLTAGVLLRRHIFALTGTVTGGIWDRTVFTGDTSGYSVDVQRSISGLGLLWYYEPNVFRHRWFGLSPGLRAGFWRVRDEIMPTDTVTRGEDYAFGRFAVPMLKMRLGKRRIFATLEYGWMLGQVAGRTSWALASAGTNRTISYESGQVHFLTLGVATAF